MTASHAGTGAAALALWTLLGMSAPGAVPRDVASPSAARPAAATPPAAPAAPAARARALPRDSLYHLLLPLTDQSGRTRPWVTRRGTPQLVSMFYTSCPYICPLIVDSGKAIERQLTPAQRARLGILLVSMDPARDTPAALQAVVDARRLDARRWTLAAPAPSDVRAVAGVLGIRYRALADGEFNHTSALVLLDAEGRILARTEQVGVVPDPDFVAEVRRATSAAVPYARARALPRPDATSAPSARTVATPIPKESNP